MKLFGATHIGHVRRLNQDQFLICEKGVFKLCVICDGMGGANAGEVASLQACTSLKESFEQHLPKSASTQDLTTWLKEAIQNANLSVYKMAKANPAYQGMGTTLVATLFSNEHGIVANIGDSRAYLMDEHQSLIQITDDHSLVNSWIKSGKMSLEESKLHPQRSVLTNVVGVTHPVSLDIFEIDVAFSELLICSDGLHGMLSDSDIETLLNHHHSTHQKVENLIQAALNAGGQDNVTVVLLHKGQS